MVNTKTTVSKKVLAIVLAVACMVAFTPAIAFTSSAHAAAFKVSPTKATVYVGKYKTLKSTKTATWKSSKKSVAKLTASKGKTVKVKGVKAGKATIKVTYKGTTKKIAITVKKATKVTAVTVTDVTSNSTTVSAGDTLKTTVAPSGAAVTYQWYAGTTKIVGATESTYQVAGIYVGKAITCKVTGYGSYSGTVTSTATTAVVSAKVSAVAITDATGAATTAVVGTALTATTTPTNATVTYQWYRAGYAIDGATSKTYTPVAADLTKELTVKVTSVADSGFTGTATSAPATVVTDLAKAAAITVTKNTAGTTATAAVKLTSTAATDITSNCTLAWYVDSVSDATQLYTTAAATTKVTDPTVTFATLYYYADKSKATLVGHKLICVATGNGSTYGGKLTSAATDTITDALATETYSITTPADIKVGAKVTATFTTTNSSASPTVTYQWYRGVDAISGATAASYTPTSADLGYTLTCKITGTGSISGSIGTAMAGPVLATTLTAAVADAALGNALTATVTPAVAASDVTYQWYVTSVADANKISSATSASYTPTATGTYVCRVSTTSAAYGGTVGTPAYVDATASVGKALTSVTLSGTETTTGTLTATVLPAGTAITTDYTVAWYLDSTAANNQIGTYSSSTFTGASGSTLALNGTYVLKGATGTNVSLAGHKVICVVTGANAYVGSKVTATSGTITGVIAKPTISGNAAVGDTLTMNAALGTLGTDYTLQWYADGDIISGATAATYKLTTAEYGKQISVMAKGIGAYAGSSDVSTKTLAVAGLAATATKTASPKVGTTLGLTFAPADAANYVTYAWVCNGATVSTDATYVATQDCKDYGVTLTITPKTGTNPYTYATTTYTWASGDFE